MPFCDAMELFENCPPLNAMLSHCKPEETNPMELGQAVSILGGRQRRPRKLKDAPELDRQRFEHLKKQVKRG